MRPQYSNLLSEISYPGTVPKNSVFCIHIPKNRYYYYCYYYSTQYSYVCTYTYTLYIYMRERESIDTRINSAFLLDILGIFGLPQKAPFLSHPIKHTKAHCRGPPPEAPTFSLREHGGVASPGSFPVAPKFYPGNLEMGLSITGVPQ